MAPGMPDPVGTDDADTCAGRGPRISIVVAVAENDVIGCDGRLPWHMPSDLKVFRRLTLGKPVVMGRRTFESIGKPLAQRDNIVVSRSGGQLLDVQGIEVVQSFQAALDHASRRAADRNVDEVMIIGGAQVYEAALPAANRVYLTRIHACPAGNVKFPELEPSEWTVSSETALETGDSDDHAATLIVLDRNPTRSGSEPNGFAVHG